MPTVINALRAVQAALELALQKGLNANKGFLIPGLMHRAEEIAAKRNARDAAIRGAYRDALADCAIAGFDLPPHWRALDSCITNDWHLTGSLIDGGGRLVIEPLDQKAIRSVLADVLLAIIVAEKREGAAIPATPATEAVTASLGRPETHEARGKAPGTTEPKCPRGIGDDMHRLMCACLSDLQPGSFVRRANFDNVSADDSAKSRWLKDMCEQGVLKHNGRKGAASAYAVVKR